MHKPNEQDIFLLTILSKGEIYENARRQYYRQLVSGVLLQHASLHHLSWNLIGGLLRTVRDLHPQPKL
jgi:hypothetical protein